MKNRASTRTESWMTTSEKTFNRQSDAIKSMFFLKSCTYTVFIAVTHKSNANQDKVKIKPRQSWSYVGGQSHSSFSLLNIQRTTSVNSETATHVMQEMTFNRGRHRARGGCGAADGREESVASWTRTSGDREKPLRRVWPWRDCLFVGDLRGVCGSNPPQAPTTPTIQTFWGKQAIVISTVPFSLPHGYHGDHEAHIKSMHVLYNDQKILKKWNFWLYLCALLPRRQRVTHRPAWRRWERDTFCVH